MKHFIPKTPKAPASLEQLSVTRQLNDGVHCPCCGKLYGSIHGFQSSCKHLQAHFGPFGWERTPKEAGKDALHIQDEKAFDILLVASIDSIVDKVVSGNEEGDIDWLIWQKPACDTALVA